MRASLLFLVVVMASWPLNAVGGGPNDGGTLILHANTSLVYTSDPTSWCGQTGLSACSLATVTVPLGPATTRVFFALAAFPEGSSPRLKALAFGVDWDPERLVLLGSGPCGADPFEIRDDSWPGPGTGVGMSWPATRTGLLSEIYWYAGYGYSATDTTSFALTPHPVQGGQFADDAAPPVVDAVAGYGRLGFGVSGLLPCPLVPGGGGDSGAPGGDGDVGIPEEPDGAGDESGGDEPGGSGSPAFPGTPALAFVEVTPASGGEFSELVDRLARDHDLRVLVSFVPDGVICRASEAQLVALSNDPRVTLATASLILDAPPLGETDKAPGEAGLGRSLWNELLIPDSPDSNLPGFPYPCCQPDTAMRPDVPTWLYQTSDFMMGHVGLSLIFMESEDALDCAVTDTTENWQTSEMDDVQGKYIEALVELSQAQFDAHVQFQICEFVTAPTSYEPIRIDHDEDWRYWKKDAYEHVGYPGSLGPYEFANARRAENHKDWYFTAFVVRDVCDGDGSFPDGYFAYADYGGPSVVTTRSCDGWGLANLDIVAAHEICHVFGALDEYGACAEPWTCDWGWGYLHVRNGNCIQCVSPQETCLMAGASGRPLPICSYSRGQIGWRDTDTDGVLDPVQQPDCATSMRLEGLPLEPGNWVDIYRSNGTTWVKRIAMTDWQLDHGETLWDGFDHAGNPVVTGTYRWTRNSAGAQETAVLLEEQYPPTIPDAFIQAGAEPHLQFRFTDSDTHCGRARVRVLEMDPPASLKLADQFYLDSIESGSPIDVPLGELPSPSTIELRVWDTGGGRNTARLIPYSVSQVDDREGRINRSTLGPGLPNPAGGTVSWRLGDGGAPIRSLQVLGIDGRLIRRLPVDGSVAGAHWIFWDGRDERGHLAPAGRYYMSVVTQDGTRRVGEVTVTR